MKRITVSEIEYGFPSSIYLFPLSRGGSRGPRKGETGQELRASLRASLYASSNHSFCSLPLAAHRSQIGAESYFLLLMKILDEGDVKLLNKAVIAFLTISMEALNEDSATAGSGGRKALKR